MFTTNINDVFVSGDIPFAYYLPDIIDLDGGLWSIAAELGMASNFASFMGDRINIDSSL